MATEMSWLQAVKNKHPDGIVYADDYLALPKVLGMQYFSLRSYAKQAGFKDIREWLASENCYIDMERDMYVHEERFEELSGERLEEGVKAIYRDFALLGQRVLPPVFVKALTERAQMIFNSILEQDLYTLSDIEQEIITLAIVYRVKDRYRQEQDEKERQFWNYVYAQFGFRHAKEDSAAVSKLYTTLCTAIKTALRRNHRYFASDKMNTHRYYTSLRLHALAPLSSMENLFEILLTFYIEDLDACYIPGDAAYKALVSALASRWDKNIEIDDDLHVRSLDIYSGMRVLFSERKAFMRSFCEQIVCRIDALIHAQGQQLNPNDYLDVLLQKWYGKRAVSLEEVQKQRRERNPGVASNAASLRLCYALEKGHVVLKVPAIRLDEVKENYPVLQILQNGSLMHQQELDTYGRLVWTTRAAVIVLEDTRVDFDQLSSLQVRILYDTEVLYDSARLLNRDYIIFDSIGTEINRQRTREGEQYCLFTGDAASITYAEDAEIYYEDHRGQLFEIRLTENTWIRVNGMDIWISKDRKKTFKHAASIEKVRHIWAVEGGQQYTLYPAAFTMQFDLPEGEISAKYEIGVDNKWSSLLHYCPDGQRFDISMPSEVDKPHCIQFRQITDHRVLYEYRYMIIPGLRISHAPLCFDNGKPITVEIQTEAMKATHHVLPEGTGDELILPLPDKSFDFRIKLPLVRCIIGDTNGLTLPESLWHEAISRDSFIHVVFPRQWRCDVLIDTCIVPASSDRPNWYELGNFLRAYHPPYDQSPLNLVFRSDTMEPILWPLTTLQFKARFLHSPLYVDDHRLLWQPEGSYIGPADADMTLYVDIPGQDSFQYALYTKELDGHFPYDGSFTARIVKTEKSVFSKTKETVIWEEDLQFGNPYAFRFASKFLYPMEARCWDWRKNRYQTIHLNSDYLCIYQMEYVGHSKPFDDEDEEMPEYTACCSFFDPRCQEWRPYNSNEFSDAYEWINPVRVWIANDQVLTMKCASEDGIIVDTRYGSFVNRKLTREEENQYMQIPDYIMYRLEE